MKDFEKANQFQERLAKWLPRHIAWKLALLVLQYIRRQETGAFIKNTATTQSIRGKHKIKLGKRNFMPKIVGKLAAKIKNVENPLIHYTN